MGKIYEGKILNLYKPIDHKKIMEFYLKKFPKKHKNLF